MKIEKVRAREVYDASALPTVECQILLSNGISVSSRVAHDFSLVNNETDSIDSAAPTQMAHRAIETIESIIAPILIGREPELVSMDLELIELDGTQDKLKLSKSALLATSIAILRAQAAVESMEPYELIGYLCEYSSVTLPYAIFNCINGGTAAPGNIRMRELMIVPVNAESMRACIDAARTFYYFLYEHLKKNFSEVKQGMYGGLSANFKDDAQALDVLMYVIEQVQKRYSHHFLLALNVDAGNFYNSKNNTYDWHGKKVSSEELIDLYQRLIKHYPLFAIEDGASPADQNGWIAMTKALKDSVQIVGGEIFGSSAHAIAHALENGIATGALIKPIEVGTLTETLQSIKLCKEYEMACIVSQCTNETNDTIIVDLAVGASAGYIKAGAPYAGQHIAKYNELLRVEDLLMLSLME